MEAVVNGRAIDVVFGTTRVTLTRQEAQVLIQDLITADQELAAWQGEVRSGRVDLGAGSEGHDPDRGAAVTGPGGDLLPDGVRSRARSRHPGTRRRAETG